MGKRRKARISLVHGLFERGGHPHYEVLLDDDTHFTLSASIPFRPRTGDILTWVADGNRCPHLELNGRPTNGSEAALDRARRLLAADPCFGEWLSLGTVFDQIKVLLLKQSILAGILSGGFEASFLLDHRIPEPLIDSLVESYGKRPALADVVMLAWRAYLTEQGIEPGEDDL